MKTEKELTMHELNVLTAEKVMGWRREHKLGRVKNIADWFYVVPDAELHDERVVIPDNSYTRIKDWSPTTDAGQALAVLERCVILTDVQIRRDDDSSTYLVSSPSYSVRLVNGIATELPLAICRFAAKLFGGEK